MRSRATTRVQPPPTPRCHRRAGKDGRRCPSSSEWTNAPTARPVREHEAEFAIAFGHAKRVNGTVAVPPLAAPAVLVGSLLAYSSLISPVATRMTWTALPITSAGRFSPLGPRGTLRLLL